MARGRPIPDDWDQELDGYQLMLVCVPNSTLWRGIVRGQIYELTRGRNWDETTGDVILTQVVGLEIYESIEMACLEDLTRIADGVEAINTTLTNIDGRLKTSNWIAPDQNLADILANSLFGNFPDIPHPLQGTGVADIIDDQIEILHNRFRMADSSIFNPLTEKNITETLETTLRRDRLSDLEFLTPNIATILENALNTGDSAVIALLKNVIDQLVSKLDLPPSVASWLKEVLETDEQLSAADLLLLLAQAGSFDGSNIANAIKQIDASTVVNVNNGCGCEGDCQCGASQTVFSTAAGGGGGGEYPQEVVDIVD